MKTQSILVMAMVLFGTGYAMVGSWTTLDKPGATSTFAFGIDGDNIAGEYFVQSNFNVRLINVVNV